MYLKPLRDIVIHQTIDNQNRYVSGNY